jgi:hypothetical protein
LSQIPFGTATLPTSWKNPAARTADTSAREQPSAAAAVAASSATRVECPCRKPSFKSANSPKDRATDSSPALEIVATGCGSAAMTRPKASETSAARRSASGSARAASTTCGS